jgi:hypothetical protein
VKYELGFYIPEDAAAVKTNKGVYDADNTQISDLSRFDTCSRYNSLSVRTVTYRVAIDGGWIADRV